VEIKHPLIQFAYGLQVKSKEDVWHQRLLGKIFYWLGDESYREFNCTTIGGVIYTPKMVKDVLNDPILAHEVVHVRQHRAWGWIWEVSYLFPQILGLLALKGFWNPMWFLWALCFLPLPAPFRMWSELKAYKTTMSVDYWRWGGMNLEQFQAYLNTYLLPKFTTRQYFWMWPFKGYLSRQFQAHWVYLKRDVVVDPWELACRRFAVPE